MTTVAAYNRRILNTGRQLGLRDILGKIVEIASTALVTRLRGLFAGKPIDRKTELAMQAASVRRFAYSQRDSSPGFAADLYAAADRHELTG